MDREALTIANLVKGFGERKVLVEVSLVVRQGECLALLGPSGCGKTTLLRLVAGLDDADTGSIQINGEMASNPRVRLAPNRRRVGLVFQDLALWPHMTAWQNVEFMLPAAILGRKARMEGAREMLHKVQLQGHHDNHPHELSRGQQQRVALARALAGQPTLLLLDEPFASQDSKLKSEMVDLVLEIRRATGMTMIYVTHTTEEIPRLADRVATMEAGKIGRVLSLGDFNPKEMVHENP